MGKMRAVIFGIGQNWNFYKDRLSREYEIVALADNLWEGLKKQGEVGIPLASPEKLPELAWDKIVILPSGGARLEIVRQLLALGVPSEDIVLYLPEAHRYWDSYKVSATNQGLSARFGDIVFDVLHTSDALIMDDLFLSMEYSFTGRTDSLMVLDIGMNVGLASLFFAGQPNVTAVYGFEPFAPTYEMALHNFRQNPAYIQEKLHPQCLGLSNWEGTMKLPYSEDFPGGMSVFAQQQEDGVEIHLADAAKHLAPLLARGNYDKVLMKVDVEGSECDILDSLAAAGLLERMDYIIMETHSEKDVQVKKTLSEHGFVFFYQGGVCGLGMIRAARMV